MDIVQSKFNNFKLFIEQALPLDSRGHELFLQLQNASLPMFLGTIYTKRNTGAHEVLADILDKMKLKESDIDKNDLYKLQRYMCYFTEITKELYSS